MGLTLIQHSTVLIFFPYWNLVVLPFWSFLNTKWWAINPLPSLLWCVGFFEFLQGEYLRLWSTGRAPEYWPSDTFHFACVVFVQSVSDYFARFKQVCSVCFSRPPCTFLHNLLLRIRWNLFNQTIDGTYIKIDVTLDFAGQTESLHRLPQAR